MKMNLKDHMTKKLITIDKGATIAEAHRLMTNYWIRHLPVMDSKDDYIVGMLSERDLLKAASKESKVESYMSSPIRTFEIHTPIRDVVEAMIAEKISAFLVTKGEEVVGIVTSEDLLVVLDQLLRKDNDSSSWSISEFFTNPGLQRTAYIIGQTGI